MGITYTAPPPETTGPVATLQVASADHDPYTAPPVQSWRPVRPVAAPGSARPGGSTCPPPPAPMTPDTAPTIQVWRRPTPCPAPVQKIPSHPLPIVNKGRHAPPAARRRFDPIIQQVAVAYQLEPSLLHAVISAESAYNPQARSPKGARGLMQLMPDTARRFGVSDPYDPTANLHGGARYLRWLLDLFNDLRLALAAYNAGEGAVQRYGNAIPPYPETRTYVRRVLDFYRSYRSPAGW